MNEILEKLNIGVRPDTCMHYRKCCFNKLNFYGCHYSDWMSTLQIRFANIVAAKL